MNRNSSRDMASNRRMVVVEGEAGLREELVGFLSGQGFTVNGVGSAADFYQLLFTQDRCDLVVIDSSLPDQSGLVLTEYVRNNSGAGIIMLHPGPGIDERLACYRSGADICLSKPVDAREVGAIVENMFLRRESSIPAQAAQPVSTESVTDAGANSWKLLRNEWVLMTPKSDAISLTAKEFDFLLTLVLQSTAIVTRQYILKILGYEANDQGNRALESLIYRLRRKTEAFGYGFPIKTYRGVGYCLAAPIILS